MKCYHCAKIDYQPWRLNYQIAEAVGGSHALPNPLRFPLSVLPLALACQSVRGAPHSGSGTPQDRGGLWDTADGRESG